MIKGLGVRAFTASGFRIRGFWGLGLSGLKVTGLVGVIMVQAL